MCVYVCVIARMIGCGCVEVVGWGDGILYICARVQVYVYYVYVYIYIYMYVYVYIYIYIGRGVCGLCAETCFVFM